MAKQKADSAGKVTPMMRQYNAIKAKYPQYILMFRMGDFYEMFGDDAKVAANVLGITLTRRPWGDGKDMPLAGVPFHSIEPYLAKFIRAGKKVAICDQTEDPKQAKGIVKREVVRIVTPGTILESDILDDKAHNFLASTCELRDGRGKNAPVRWGLAVADLSTGSFEVAEFEEEGASRQIFSEIGRLQPAEILLPDSLRRREGEWLDPTIKTAVSWLPDTDYDAQSARRRLLEQFQVQSLEGYGADGMSAAIAAAGALIQYLHDTQFSALRHINHMGVYNPSDYLVLDFTTQRSLELVQSIQGADRRATLLGVLDHTVTAMGGRMLRGWMLQPLKKAEAIHERLNAVEAIYEDTTLRTSMDECLRQIHDLERIISRIGLGVAGPRDLTALRQSLHQVEPLIQCLTPPPLRRDEADEDLSVVRDSPWDSEVAWPSKLLDRLRKQLDPHPMLRSLLDRSLTDNPPFAARDGGVIREGYSAELDELRALAENTSDWMEQMRQAEIQSTGIQNLKIKYNKVFGFFIEVSKGNVGSVPEHYIRKQTLVNAERYITPELKEKEEVILNAQERIQTIETRLFEEIRDECAAMTRSIQQLAENIARLDCLAGLAQAAIAGNYIKPEVDDGDTIEITAGRHPVVEALQGDRPFVPNDVKLSNSGEQVLLITGPNMAGKSTFIRQVALLTLMAHMGSFIPASRAKIGIVDRIFTRVGAMDYLVRGQSTFLVEMSETANILNNATDRSLVILDEIGRGTSTYDGLSIAWAVVEYLHSTEGRRPKTLFATHYHELTDLENELHRVRNYNVAVLEKGGDITFLYQIVKGSTDHSYGIYAGKVAGLPPSVIERAQSILHQLEFGHSPKAGGPPPDRKVKVEADDGMVQLSLFDGLDHPVLERLRNMNTDHITPMEALEILGRLVKDAR
ncbi:MAG: DNA mismatch repair protein MutS [Candidatus Sumerlaeia bacterium]